LLVTAILLPVIATLFLVTKSAGPDLFDLVPSVSHSDQYLILPWPELERAKRALKAGPISSGSKIRALGYMMEGDHPLRDGEPVRSFVLLPDAGSAVHPAHRFGDQMIEVHTDGGKLVRFRERTLVWVWGTLRMLPGDPSGHEPLYVLEDARTELADRRDIQKYFK
jgi:hypothetical protein